MVQEEVGALIERAKRGDKSAAGTLVACYRPLLAGLVAHWASRLTGEVVGEDDLWQEAYRQLLELVRSYQAGSPVSFGAYLRKGLGWRLHNVVRSERRRLYLHEPLAPEHLDILYEELQPALGVWDNPQLRAAFRKLSPRQRGVLARVYWQDRAVSAVAEALGLDARWRMQNAGGPKCV